MLGEILAGKYEIVRLLGEGGMGEVYEARRDDGHRVAVKIIHPTLKSDAVLARFEREGEVAGRLDTPHIVRALDNGTDELIDSDRIRDYRPILTFTRGQRFTHGYRHDPAERSDIMAAAGRVQTPARTVQTASYDMAGPRPLPVSIFAAPVPASAPLKR